MVDEDKNSILFVCIENSSRSQMAEAFAKRRGLKASSAGTVPAAHINAHVVQAMKERGIDVSQNIPKRLTSEMVEQARLVVLTDASLKERLDKNIVKKMRKKLVEWDLPDPQGQPLQGVRLVRDRIERMVSSLPLA